VHAQLPRGIGRKPEVVEVGLTVQQQSLFGRKALADARMLEQGVYV
jgi:hypothetical protein